jgi:lysyl-tRNA synthetase class 1
MNLGATLFLMGLEDWKKKFELGALPDMPDLLNSMLIPSDRVSIYLAGIEAFEKEDYLKCIHVLVPQVENSLRTLLTLLDIPVTKTDEDGNFELKNMNDVLLNDGVHQALEEKLWYFLNVLYIDKRGMNLRNVVAHGMAPLEAFHRVNAALVIQSIVFLTMIREEAIMFSDEEADAPD